MATRKQPARGWVQRDNRLFTLEVCIIGGPMTEKFAKKNKVICRPIQIRGDMRRWATGRTHRYHSSGSRQAARSPVTFLIEATGSGKIIVADHPSDL